MQTTKPSIFRRNSIRIMALFENLRGFEVEFLQIYDAIKKKIL